MWRPRPACTSAKLFQSRFPSGMWGCMKSVDGWKSHLAVQERTSGNLKDRSFLHGDSLIWCFDGEEDHVLYRSCSDLHVSTQLRASSAFVRFLGSIIRPNKWQWWRSSTRVCDWQIRRTWFFPSKSSQQMQTFLLNTWTLKYNVFRWTQALDIDVPTNETSLWTNVTKDHRWRF